MSSSCVLCVCLLVVAALSLLCTVWWTKRRLVWVPDARLLWFVNLLLWFNVWRLWCVSVNYSCELVPGVVCIHCICFYRTKEPTCDATRTEVPPLWRILHFARVRRQFLFPYVHWADAGRCLPCICFYLVKTILIRLYIEQHMFCHGHHKRI